MKALQFLLPEVLSCVALVALTGCGSSPSSTSTTTTTTTSAAAPTPTVTSIAPTTLTAGAGVTTLTVTGTGFVSSTSLQVGGVVEPTTYVSATEVTAQVPASQLASGGTLGVIALNNAGTSASGAVITLEVDNPVPAIASFTPSMVSTGAVATTVSVTGTGFVPTTAIQVNGSARSTTYVSATQVNVTLTTMDVAASGTVSLIAVNAAPGGGSSAASSIAVNNPQPGLLTVTPGTLLSGATTAQTETVGGSGFLPGSLVQVGGTNRPTTYVSGTQLTFALTVADLANAGVLAVDVVNAAPGGGTSRATNIQVLAATPTPVLTSVSPASFVVGSADMQITVSGNNLNYNSTILWNGTALGTSYSYSPYFPYGYSLYATVPASLLSAVGTASVTVSSITSAPALSNALPVTITNPAVPTLTGVSPNAGPINTAATVTLSGTGFTKNTVASYNGTALTTTFGSTTSVSVVLPASSVPLPGNGTFTVTTPAPGGGTSAGAVYTAYIGIANNSMILNPVNGLLYVSVPSSAGAPYGNSVVSVDPATGALGTPIPVGSEPNKLALTSDGRYLWVGLDGASAVRKVDLTAGVAGLQFPVNYATQYNSQTTTAVALAAVPGETDSVVVSAGSTYSQYGITIYDAGVVRGSTVVSYSVSGPTALVIDGAKGEVYATEGSTYAVYTYGASGLTQSTTVSNNYNYYGSTTDDLEVTGGLAYTDVGLVLAAETGVPQATLYFSGTTVATGPTLADTTLGKIFVLDNGANSGTPTQIQVFSATDYTSGAAIPVNGVTSSVYGVPAPSHLVRWGSNGLAFRTSAGVFSLTSNLVKDLSTTSADLAVTLTAAGGAATGTNSTYTATVRNAGPSAATRASLVAFLPSTGSLVSVTPAAGSCSTANGLSCDLGSLASGASTTVDVVVTQTTAGSSTVNVQVSGSENDPTPANNSASASATVAGAAYTVAPTLGSVTPSTVASGSGDTVITVAGTGFTSGSTVKLGGAALATTYASATQLTATVPAASLTTMGWSPVTVTTPAPGGGTTQPMPLSVFSVLSLGLNHVLYDPYTRRLMASVGSTSTALTGNSVVAITPETATVGTPVTIGSQPEAMALTQDGQVLYTVLMGNEGVSRFNMLTQQAEFSYLVPASDGLYGSNNGVVGVATEPGTEDTIALASGNVGSVGLYDFDPVHQTAKIRGTANGFLNSSCIAFEDATDLYGDSYTVGALTHYTVTALGLQLVTPNQTATLNQFSCFKIDAGVGYSTLGGVANLSSTPILQLGTFPLPTNYNTSLPSTIAPDTSLGRTFFATTNTGSYGLANLIEGFDDRTYLPVVQIPLPLATTEGTSYTISDVVRWGQDGLALLTSGGNLYLMRGAAVVPGLLGQSSAATLTASSVSAIAHGSGNAVLTLSGSNFQPGVAVTWNGTYRTTTIADATHVTVDLPASDVAVAGSGSLVAVNPGAGASGALTIAVQ